MTGKASVTGTAPAGTSYCFFHINAPIGAGSFAIDDLYARRMCDANLIVDGSISASKLLVGAAVGDIETVGSPTADVIYFTDGFCLNTLEPKESGANVTSAHVLTSSVSPSTSTQNTEFSSAYIACSGFGWTVSVSGTSDVYNILADLVLGWSDAGTSSNLTIAVVVDGNTASPAFTRTFYTPFAQSSASNFHLAIFGSITGLASGSHSIAFYIQGNGSNGLFTVTPQSVAQLQRIY